jgi:F-type H+-transporting ATPase subunit delta
MLAGSLARRYAKALLGLAIDGKDKTLLDKVGSDLRSLRNAYQAAPELGEVLANPAFKRAQRKAVLDALLTKIGAQDLVKTFTYLLLDKERLAVLPDISREIDAMIEARAGKVQAQVTSAVALTAAQLKQITATLEKLSGKKVVVEKKQDPALLGGVVAKVGDVVYDGSLRTQLRALRDQLAK